MWRKGDNMYWWYEPDTNPDYSSIFNISDASLSYTCEVLPHRPFENTPRKTDDKPFTNSYNCSWQHVDNIMFFTFWLQVALSYPGYHTTLWVAGYILLDGHYVIWHMLQSQCDFGNPVQWAMWDVVYSLFGWLVPLMLVGICTGFTFLSTLPMGYDMYITCWLPDSSSMFYLLIVPMMIFLLGNICFFFESVWQLKQLSANAADVGRNSGTQERLSIGWKMSSLSGGAWIFAIIGNVSSSNALMICFMLLNAFQGIHIFLSFGLSRNVVACHRAVGGQQGYSNNPEGQITAHMQPVSLLKNTPCWFSIIWCGLSVAMGLMDIGRSVVSMTLLSARFTNKGMNCEERDMDTGETPYHRHKMLALIHAKKLFSHSVLTCYCVYSYWVKTT